MKKLSTTLSILLMCLMVGCIAYYDDSEIRSDIEDLQERVQALEEMCREMNSNIEALQSIVTAQQNGDYITNVEPITDEREIIGYTITFAKGTPITIYHGEDGKDGTDGENGNDGQDGTDGKDGYTPQIGVKKDTDNIYYWTLDGEWLLDENGNKIKAQGTDGKDGQDGENGADGNDGANGNDGATGPQGPQGEQGITPMLKIEDDYWYVSYDNGQSWTQLGKSTGEQGPQGESGANGDSFFQSVTQDEQNVYFTLADGTVITLPKGAALDITFAESDLVVMSPSSTREIAYTVTSVTEKVTVEVTSSADIKAKVVAADATGKTGKIVITTGATIDEYSKVIVFVSNGEKVTMKSISFEQAGLEVSNDATLYAPAEGGNVTLSFLSNVECEVVIPEEAQEWISLAPTTRAMTERHIALQLTANEGAKRNAVVTIQSEDGNLSVNYTIEQATSLDYQLALEREALIAIYNALDGDNWTNNENWCSEKPIDEWYGVSTNGRSVTTLSIVGQVTVNSPKGVFPIEAQNLTSLENLNLERTNIDSFADGLSFSNIEGVSCLDNVFLHLTELAPIYKGGNLKSLSVGFNDHNLYNISDSYLTPTPIPDELLANKQLHTLRLWGCNLSGELPDKLWELENIEYLELYNLWETYLYGVIPPAIANLQKLNYLRLFNLNLSGGIPEELYNLTQLQYLSIDNCHIGGQLSPNIQNLKGLRSINLRSCDLEGNLPEELAILLDADLVDCLLGGNMITGNIPDKIKNHPKWAKIWSSIVFGNQLNITVGDVPAPVFDTYDVWGNEVISDDVYSKNSYTIVYGFDIAFFPYISNAVYSCHDVHKLYNVYKRFGVDVIMFDGSGYSGPGTKTEAMKKFLTTNNLPWSAIMSNPFGMTAIPYIVIVNSQGKVVYTTVLTNPLFDDIRKFFEEIFPNAYYTSTDYSQDGVVTTLQTASVGEGIDIVLMGDAYSDRQIADGTYKADMENLYNNLFTEEPYKSFKDYFNVYCVNVVSETEGYEYGNTALDTYFGDGTTVGGTDSAVFNYAQKAIGEERMDEAMIVVAMNSDNYAGTCWMYYPEGESDYGKGVSISYFPRGGDAETFAALLHHEACGHGFAKLADEYAYEEYGAITDLSIAEIQDQHSAWGWWKNVDFTNDPSEVLWSRFLADERYANEGLGVFEGGLTYWSGVWRPSENSIMRYNTGGFNAPSREAIYYRIHKLAYGAEWEYDYEEFVEWDAINRTTAASAPRKVARIPMRQMEHTAPPVVVKKSWREAMK